MDWGQSRGLTFITQWANSADDKLVIFFFNFAQKTIFNIFMYNLHEMSKTVTCFGIIITNRSKIKPFIDPS